MAANSSIPIFVTLLLEARDLTLTKFGLTSTHARVKDL